MARSNKSTGGVTVTPPLSRKPRLRRMTKLCEEVTEVVQWRVVYRILALDMQERWESYQLDVYQSLVQLSARLWLSGMADLSTKIMQMAWYCCVYGSSSINNYVRQQLNICGVYA